MPSMATAAAVADAPAVVELRTCKRCSERKPLDAFVRTNASGDQPRYLHLCRACKNAYRAAQHRRQVDAGEVLSSSTARERQARIRAAYGHDFVRYAPDPAPARLLLDLLADSRRVGLPFDVAWSEDVEFVLAHTRTRPGGIEAERASWREAFESTKTAWRAAYEGVDAPDYHLGMELVAEPSGDRSDLVMLS